MRSGLTGFIYNLLKAKDTPWDAVLTGSVVCTVDAKLQDLLLLML